MANFKLCISDPASKKAYQKETDQSQSGLSGKKIGEKVQGDALGLPGYELEVTGGSDNEGFPMRRDVEGSARKRIILTSPPGYHPEKFGKRRRKSVRGNTISVQISQVNLKVVKTGHKKLESLMGAKEEPKAEEKLAEKKEEKPSEQPKKEKPKEAKTEKAAEVKGSPDEHDKAAKAEAKMGVKKLE